MRNDKFEKIIPCKSIQTQKNWKLMDKFVKIKIFRINFQFFFLAQSLAVTLLFSSEIFVLNVTFRFFNRIITPYV